MASEALPATTQNRGETVVTQAHGGALRPFPAGNRANPGGRPKSLSTLICEQTLDGRELVAFMVNVMRGRRKASLRQRMEAVAWLADRGFGKALQQMEVSGPGAEPLTIRIEYGESPARDDADGDPVPTP